MNNILAAILGFFTLLTDAAWLIKSLFLMLMAAGFVWFMFCFVWVFAKQFI